MYKITWSDNSYWIEEYEGDTYRGDNPEAEYNNSQQPKFYRTVVGELRFNEASVNKPSGKNCGSHTPERKDDVGRNVVKEVEGSESKHSYSIKTTKAKCTDYAKYYCYGSVERRGFESTNLFLFHKESDRDFTHWDCGCKGC